MFRVKWVTHLGENGITETEKAIEGDLDKLAYSCIEKLSRMRMSPSGTPPDGFLIFNEDGKEMRRWFGSPPPLQKPILFDPYLHELHKDQTDGNPKIKLVTSNKRGVLSKLR